jgi:hypothetical protein
VKPGLTTTEFWQTLLVQLIAVTVTVGSLWNSRFTLDGLRALVPSAAILAAALAQAFYTHSRGTVKAAAASNATPDATCAPPSAAAHQGNPAQPASGLGPPEQFALDPSLVSRPALASTVQLTVQGFDRPESANQRA